METGQHTTVLLNEAIDSLISTPDGHYIDATFGRGGHTRLLLSRLSSQGRVSGFDKDPQAIEAAKGIQDDRFSIIHKSFAALAELPAASVQGVLMDLGVSSPQIDDAQRGFSFMRDGPLDMRMDCSAGQTAAQWLQEASEAQIAQVIRDYGEERFAKPIAKAIRAHIEAGHALTRTLELAQLIAGAVRTREGGQHPATRSFQALRIAVNRELEDLEQALQECLRILAAGGRLVVISFHSLEDRIVKQFMAKNSRENADRNDPNWLFSSVERAGAAMKLEAIERIKPSEHEIKNNPRARSAMMRVATRSAAGFAQGALA